METFGRVRAALGGAANSVVAGVQHAAATVASSAQQGVLQAGATITRKASPEYVANCLNQVKQFIPSLKDLRDIDAEIGESYLVLFHFKGANQFALALNELPSTYDADPFTADSANAALATLAKLSSDHAGIRETKERADLRVTDKKFIKVIAKLYLLNSVLETSPPALPAQTYQLLTKVRMPEGYSTEVVNAWLDAYGKEAQAFFIKSVEEELASTAVLTKETRSKFTETVNANLERDEFMTVEAGEAAAPAGGYVGGFGAGGHG